MRPLQLPGARGAPPPRRRSASAAAARRREAERILSLTPLERALLALELGERCRAWAELAGVRGRGSGR